MSKKVEGKGIPAVQEVTIEKENKIKIHFYTYVLDFINIREKGQRRIKSLPDFLKRGLREYLQSKP